MTCLETKIREILNFPPHNRARELWRAMNIEEAVITYNYHGEVELTVYDKGYKRVITEKLFSFNDVLEELAAVAKQIQCDIEKAEKQMKCWQPRGDAWFKTAYQHGYFKMKEILGLLVENKEENHT